MSRDLLNVGIAGCGMVAQTWHIPGFLADKNIRIAAVCDMNDELAATVARKYGIKHHYSNLADMIENEQLDIIDICIPQRQHAAFALQGLQAGCHILVEKPMATNCTEADEMIKASERHRRKICVVHNRLFHPVVMKALSMLRNGAIGTIAGVEIRDALRQDHPKLTDGNHWCHKLPAGVFSEFLPHPVYLAERFVSAFEQIEVFTMKTRPESWLKADEVRVMIKGKRGLATILASCNSLRNTNTINISGTKKQLHVDVYNSLLVTESTRNESKPWRALDNINQGWQYATNTISAAANTILGNYHVGHAVIIRQFVQSILNDTDSPVPPQEGKELIKNLEIIENKIRHSLNLT